ncbi:hypothetical protein B4Q13_22180, partial [Lacticaseibacillus rhamnosus]
QASRGFSWKRIEGGGIEQIFARHHFEKPGRLRLKPLGDRLQFDPESRLTAQYLGEVAAGASMLRLGPREES